VWFLWIAPAWILVWGAIAAVILAAKGFEWWIGLLLGVFGPIGIVVAAVVKSNPDAHLPPPPTGAQWVADPTRRHELRLWDGRQWTAHVSDRGVSAYDPL
jgi:hypothetical protein